MGKRKLLITSRRFLTRCVLDCIKNIANCFLNSSCKYHKFVISWSGDALKVVRKMKQLKQTDGGNSEVTVIGFPTEENPKIEI